MVGGTAPTKLDQLSQALSPRHGGGASLLLLLAQHLFAVFRFTLLKVSEGRIKQWAISTDSTGILQEGAAGAAGTGAAAILLALFFFGIITRIHDIPSPLEHLGSCVDVYGMEMISDAAFLSGKIFLSANFYQHLLLLSGHFKTSASSSSKQKPEISLGSQGRLGGWGDCPY